MDNFDNKIYDTINEDIWKRVNVTYKKKFPEEQHLEEIINITEDSLFGKLELSTLSATGNVSGVLFSEAIFTNLLTADENIFIIKSNFGTDCYDLENDQYVQQEWGKKLKKMNNKQKKRDEKTQNGLKVRKMRGDDSSLSSQISFHVRLHKDANKHVFISLFTNGKANIMGTKDIYLKEAYVYLNVVVKKISPLLQTTPRIVRLYVTMYNYRFSVNYPLVVPLNKLYKQLNHEQKTSKTVDIHAILYDQEKCPAKLTLKLNRIHNVDVYYPTPASKNIKISIKCYQDNKINIHGYVPEILVNEVYRWLRTIYYKILVEDVIEKYKHKYDII